MRRLHSPPVIEPLEPRIAPAAVVFTATSYGDTFKSPKTGLTLLQFFNVNDPTLTGTNLAIAKSIGQFTPVSGSPYVYFIKITAGEDLRIPTSVGFQDMVNVSKGTVVAVFTDEAGNGLTDAVGSNDLTGLAMGTKTSVALGTGVSQYQVNGAGPYYGGFIVTDYNDATGVLGGTSLLSNTVKSLTVAGPVTGGFIAGGKVSKLDATGTVNEILTGYAANGTSFGFEGMPNGNTTLSVALPAPGVAGPSISSVIIGSTTPYVKAGVGGIQLGTGGAGAAGGSISGLTLLDQISGFTVLAGAGGAGAASGKTFGGKGGSISGVVLNGPLGSGATNANMVLQGGAGGVGSGSAKGGAGGAVQNVYIDYNSASASDPSLTTVTANITVQGGAGGAGGTAGAGGSLKNINAITTTPGENQLSPSNVVGANDAYEVDSGGLVLVQGTAGTTGLLLSNNLTFGQGLVGDTVIDNFTGATTTVSAVNAAGTQLTLTTPNFITGADPYEVVDSLGVPIVHGTATSASIGTSVLSNTNAVFGQSLVGGTLKDDVTSASTTVAAVTVAPPEFQLLGGMGGSSTVGGKGGVGGSIATVQLINQALPPIDPNTSIPYDSSPASPTNVQFLIAAGTGGNVATHGAGGAGGSVSGLTLKGYNFTIDGGAGGNGVSAGGKGGALSSVTVLGSAGALPGDNFHALSLVVATGNGGNATAGKGGAGGALSGMNVENANFGLSGYQLASLQPAGTTPTGLDVTTGMGGTATKGAGGAGGAMLNVKITDADFLTDSHPLGNSGNANVATGAGGQAQFAGGKGGAGGAMSNVTVIGTRLSVALNTNNNIGGVSTGAGGAAGSGAGIGKGGAGGKMTSVAIRTGEGLYPSTVTDTAGVIYDTNQTFTGAAVGDTVENLATLATSTVTSFVLANELGLADNIIAAGDPYVLQTEQITGTDMEAPAGVAPSQNTLNDTSAHFIADGIKVGDVVEDVTGTQANTQAGNDVPPVTAIVTAVNSAMQLVLSADISHVGDQYEFPSLGMAQFVAGAGGKVGTLGTAGAGGSILNSSADVSGGVSFFAGNGGAITATAGATAKSGAGGSLSGDAALSNYSYGILHAGSAGGATPANPVTIGKSGAGGSITKPDVQALTLVSIIAGDGAAGGKGGSITGGGYSGVLKNGGGFNPPSGEVTVQAGAGGSSATGNGGAGGTISTITGFISNGTVDGSGHPIITSIVAGAGGNGVAKAGAGGSVEKVRFFGGGGDGGIFYINAGNAGNDPTGKTGAKGGNVTDIGGGTFASGSSDANFSVNPLTDFHHITAGNGGNATGKGGLGGSVTYVFVNAAIGIRYGESATTAVAPVLTGLYGSDPFGFDIAGVNGAIATGAGGISAGSGGTGAKAGKAGNVSNITADAIASIVAGSPHINQAFAETNLATKVDGIILNGNAAPSLVQTFNLTFGGNTTVGVGTTVNLPTNASDAQVASALNALASIPAGGVTVKSTSTGYIVTFVANGAQAVLTSSEPAIDSDGTTTEVAAGVSPSPSNLTGTQEQQNVQVTLNPFSLSFGGQTTPVLYQNATPAQVENALNALTNIQGAGGVTVSAGTGNNNPGYLVTFDTAGPQSLGLVTAVFAPYSTEQTAGNATTAEAQNVQVLAADPFTLSFGGQTTGQLAASDTAANVSAALNLLTSIQNAGGVNVTAGTGTSNPSYSIVFNSPGAESLIIPNFTAGVATVAGTTTTPQVATLTFPARGDLAPPQFATANFVGSIANILQANALGPNAIYFKSTDPLPGTFHWGDAPIDGLVAALSLTSNKNFTPNAFVTADASGAAVLI